MSSPRHADPARRESDQPGPDAPVPVVEAPAPAPVSARPQPHGHSHTHDHELADSVRTTTRTRVVVLALLIPVLLATVLGAVALWPDGSKLPPRQAVTVPGAAFLHGTALGDADKNGNVKVRIDEVGTPAPDPTDPDAVATVPTSDGKTITANAPAELVQHGFSAGDKLVLLYLPSDASVPASATTGTGSTGTGSTGTGSTGATTKGDDTSAPTVGDVDGTNTPYGVVDFDRRLPVGLLAITFGVLVVVVARWRGLAAIVGLGVSIAVVAYFTVPALLEGHSAIAVAVVTAVAVMFSTLYLAHGFTIRTSTALLGTLAGIVVTAALAWWASGAAEITGATTEESFWIPSQAPHVSLAGVALCGMIIAGLGALNDVTITQASSVWELRALAPDASRRSLFTSAMRIGRDHIASTVYTLAFAYLGASLPLLLAVWLQDEPTTLSLTTGSIVEEIVRTLVGAIGLVLAIPLTTAIAAVCVPGRAGVVEPGTSDGDAHVGDEPAAPRDPDASLAAVAPAGTDGAFWGDTPRG